MTDRTPRTDDFRLVRSGDTLQMTFTPTGAIYTFPLSPDGSVPEPQVSPARAASDYDEAEVRRAATEIARLAMSGGSHRG